MSKRKSGQGVNGDDGGTYCFGKPGPVCAACADALRVVLYAEICSEFRGVIKSSRQHGPAEEADASVRAAATHVMSMLDKFVLALAPRAALRSFDPAHSAEALAADHAPRNNPRSSGVVIQGPWKPRPPAVRDRKAPRAAKGRR